MKNSSPSDALNAYISEKAKSLAPKTDEQFLEDRKRGIPCMRASDMSPAVYTIYAELLLMQFFCEFWGGEQYRRALRSGIVPEEKSAQQFFGRIVEEEFGHAALIGFGSLGEAGSRLDGPLALLAINPLPFIESSPETQIRILRIFQHSGFKRWSEIVVYNHFQDRSAKLQLSDFASGPFLPWSKVLTVIDEEEKEHVRHGEKWFLRLAKTEKGRRMLQEDVNRWFPHVMDVFGNPGTGGKHTEAMLKFGIKQMGNDEARGHFHEEVTPLLVHCGLTLPEWTYRSHRSLRKFRSSR